MPDLTPGEQLWTLEDAESEIAELRGEIDILGEHIETQDIIASGAITATAGTASSPTLIITDSWNSLGALTGYTVNVGRYRLTADGGELELDIDVLAGGANGGNVTFANVLPSGPPNYRPPIDRRLPLSTTRAVTAADVWPRLFVTAATGQVQIVQSASNSAQLGTCVRIPLS